MSLVFVPLSLSSVSIVLQLLGANANSHARVNSYGEAFVAEISGVFCL
jgi:hypothetical protein